VLPSTFDGSFHVTTSAGVGNLESTLLALPVSSDSGAIPCSAICRPDAVSALRLASSRPPSLVASKGGGGTTRSTKKKQSGSHWRREEKNKAYANAILEGFQESYEYNFSSPYYTNAHHTEHRSIPAFQPAVAYFTPISESDFTDALTPTSMHPTVEFSPVSTGCAVDHLSPHPVSIEGPRPTRPRSEPSHFHHNQHHHYHHASGAPYHLSPEPEPKGDGLGIEHMVQLTPASSPRPQLSHSVGSLPDTPQSAARSVAAAGNTGRYYLPIAPNPAGLRQLQTPHKRKHSDDEYDVQTVLGSPQPSQGHHSHSHSLSGTLPPAAKRQHRASPGLHMLATPSLGFTGAAATAAAASTPSTSAVEISEEDSFLLRLKDEENLTWREIASRFQSDLSKTYQIPALQMRLKRLRERMRTWTDVDVQALRMAHEFWLTNKFDIMASKVSFPETPHT
jgi:hypothetical protein